MSIKFFNTYPTMKEAIRARQKEWGASKLPLSFFGNELGGEVGELIEEILVLGAMAGRVQNTVKKLDREEAGLVGSRDNVNKLEEEIGDVMICLRLLGEKLGIDVSRAERKKFNKTSNDRGLKTRVWIFPEEEK